MHFEDEVLQTSRNTECLKSSEASAKSFMWPALIFSRKGKNLGLIMEKTLWKNNLNFVRCNHYISKLHYNCDYTLWQKIGVHLKLLSSRFYCVDRFRKKLFVFAEVAYTYNILPEFNISKYCTTEGIDLAAFFWPYMTVLKLIILYVRFNRFHIIKDS
jgi:hypothetical protein